MFYAKWSAQVLLIMTLMASVVLLAPPIAVAALLLLVAPLWSMWLLANLMLHLMRKPARDAPIDHASQPSTNNGTHLTAASRIHRARVARADLATQSPHG
jgi:cytochrome c-type biogenesis protein CcmH/NrfF